MSAVPAEVEEAAQDACIVAGEEDRALAGPYGRAGSGGNESIRPTETSPGVVEEVPQLPLEQLGRRVSDAWKRVAHAKIGERRLQQTQVARRRPTSHHSWLLPLA